MPTSYRVRIYLLLLVSALVPGLTGCQTFFPSFFPTPTPTATPIPLASPTLLPTRTPLPTSTMTSTPEPTSTATPTPTGTDAPPTSNLNALERSEDLSTQCRAVVDGMKGLKANLEFPENLMSPDLKRSDFAFNPNDYFNVLTHLKMAPGYSLDYVYFGDSLGGLPVMYARKADAMPFESYDALLASFGERVTDERSYKTFGRALDYLEQVRADGSPESYLEFVDLALTGGQFYLSWHANYNDLRILCDAGDLKAVREELQGFPGEPPAQVFTKAGKIDFTPRVTVGETSVTVRVVGFTKWGGFSEFIYEIDKANPAHVLDAQSKRLVEYDCGIMF